MDDMSARIVELKKTIDNLSDEIDQKITSDQIEKAETLMLCRLDYIIELVELAKGRVELRDYLLKLQNRDFYTAAPLSKEQEMLKTSLINIDNLKQYLVV